MQKPAITRHIEDLKPNGDASGSRRTQTEMKMGETREQCAPFVASCAFTREGWTKKRTSPSTQNAVSLKNYPLTRRESGGRRPSFKEAGRHDLGAVPRQTTWPFNATNCFLIAAFSRPWCDLHAFCTLLSQLSAIIFCHARNNLSIRIVSRFNY